MLLAGQKVAEIHNQMDIFLKSNLNISTLDIDNFCKDKMQEFGLISGALNYKGFPNYVCVSVNNKVCHGIGTKNEIIKSGDIVSIDIAASFDGYFGDTCVTYLIDEVSELKKQINKAAYESMWQTIEIIKAGVNVLDLGKNMENVAKSFGFNTIRDFCGHGISNKMHEDPQVPFYYDCFADHILKVGDCITIEPMVVEKSYKLKIASDGWTAITRDGGQSAQYEHTVMVLEDGYYVMTFNKYDKLNNRKNSNIKDLIF